MHDICFHGRQNCYFFFVFIVVVVVVNHCSNGESLVETTSEGPI